MGEHLVLRCARGPGLPKPASQVECSDPTSFCPIKVEGEHKKSLSPAVPTLERIPTDSPLFGKYSRVNYRVSFTYSLVVF